MGGSRGQRGGEDAHWAGVVRWNESMADYLINEEMVKMRGEEAGIKKKDHASCVYL